MLEHDETIVAIASPTTPSIRGIVRLSGADSLQILDGISCPESTFESASRRHPRDLDLGKPFEVVSVDVMVWRTSRSYTGQPSVEIHTEGCLPLLESIVDAAIAAGARAAKPGEFTMRAFLAGRLDLTQAEAVLGVIDAEGRGSLDHALRQLAGNVSKPLETMREDLLNLLADVEAGLDFVDEDIEFITEDVLTRRLNGIRSQISLTHYQMQSRQGTQDRTTVVLCGPPNAGKSRLLNAIAGQGVALVADLAGTTRDVVTVDIELNGHPVRFMDTAGFESLGPKGDADSEMTISAMAQSSTADAVANAGIRLHCFSLASDPTEPGHPTPSEGRRQSSLDLRVATKADLVGNQAAPGISADVITSSVTGQGVDRLCEVITQAIADRDREQTGSVVGTAIRCRESLQGALQSIDAAIEYTNNRIGQEFVATELRRATQHLGEVTGAVYTDDVLDRVFGRFCIGK